MVQYLVHVLQDQAARGIEEINVCTHKLVHVQGVQTPFRNTYMHKGDIMRQPKV